MLTALNPRATRWIFTKVKDNPRAMAAEELLEIGRGLNLRQPAAIPAVADALAGATARDEAVCVCGSIALAGEARLQWALSQGEAGPPVDEVKS
jgi:folylpolyglutamate synthase/dihydropteroate synthase